MKKILNIILCALVAFSLFTVSVSAIEAVPLGGASGTATFNEDYTRLTYKGENYSLIDGNDIGYDGAYDDEEEKQYVDAWLTDDGNEEGKVIAKINLAPGREVGNVNCALTALCKCILSNRRNTTTN